MMNENRCPQCGRDLTSPASTGCPFCVVALPAAQSAAADAPRASDEKPKTATELLRSVLSAIPPPAKPPAGEPGSSTEPQSGVLDSLTERQREMLDSLLSARESLPDQEEKPTLGKFYCHAARVAAWTLAVDSLLTLVVTVFLFVTGLWRYCAEIHIGCAEILYVIFGWLGGAACLAYGIVGGTYDYLHPYSRRYRSPMEGKAQAGAFMGGVVISLSFVFGISVALAGLLCRTFSSP